MKKTTIWILCFLMLGQLAVPACAAEFSLDETATLDGMDRSWYQGYVPTVQYNTMTLYLPIRAESCVGDITVSIALDDPHVFLLESQPAAVTVSPRDGIYPVKLTLKLERNRRNGDFPATITIRGADAQGREVLQTMPYILRIRDGSGSHETLEPVISNLVGDLNVGSEGSLTLTITNPTSTISMTEAVLTVTDPSGEVLMSGSERLVLPELLPGQSETVTVPMHVLGSAAIRQHILEISLTYRALDREGEWQERFTVPVTQSIRLEQGGAQLPSAIAGELANMTLPLMNLGSGELYNVLVKLEMEEVLDAQSVLVGTIGPGETKQAKLTFTPFLNSTGTHCGTLTYSCEDAYGNRFSQALNVTLTVDAPIPEVQEQLPEEEKGPETITIILIILSVLLAAALIVQSILLNGKLHKLEEERL